VGSGVGGRSALDRRADRRGTTLAAINVSSQAARTSVDHMLWVFLPCLKEAATEINQAIYSL
jgi:hypothetical protein